MPPVRTTTPTDEEIRLPAGGSFVVTDEIGTELFRVTASGDAVKVAGTQVTPANQAVLNAVTATAAELNVNAGVVAGTATASKTAVLGANKNLDVLAIAASGLSIGAGAGTPVTATAAELNTLAGVTAGTVTASKALVAAAGKTLNGLYARVASSAIDFAPAVTDSGTVYLVTAADKVATLPSTAAGVTYTFIITAAGLSAASTGLSISPAAVDKIMGSVLGVVITSLDNKDLINSGATDTEGNYVTVVGDGVDGWYITAGAGVWAREA